MTDETRNLRNNTAESKMREWTASISVNAVSIKLPVMNSSKKSAKFCKRNSVCDPTSSRRLLSPSSMSTTTQNMTVIKTEMLQTPQDPDQKALA